MSPPPPGAAAPVDARRFAALVVEALGAAQESAAAVAGGGARLVRGPHERALFALRARLPDESVYRSVSRRFLALMHLQATQDLGVLARAGDNADSTLLHPAVLDTAARMRLNRNGHFPPRRFVETALAAAREHYAALDWPLATDRAS